MDSNVHLFVPRPCVTDDTAAAGIVLGSLIGLLPWAIILTGLRLWTA